MKRRDLLVGCLVGLPLPAKDYADKRRDPQWGDDPQKWPMFVFADRSCTVRKDGDRKIWDIVGEDISGNHRDTYRLAGYHLRTFVLHKGIRAGHPLVPFLLEDDPRLRGPEFIALIRGRMVGLDGNVTDMEWCPSIQDYVHLQRDGWCRVSIWEC